MQRGASDLVGEHRGAAVVEQHQDHELGGSGAGAVASVRL